jgi:hypothetical protein
MQIQRNNAADLAFIDSMVERLYQIQSKADCIVSALELERGLAEAKEKAAREP